MLSFESDYIEGALPAVLDALVKSNLEQLPGYGCDRYSDSAKQKIREFCGAPGADVYLIAGGTQTNQMAISAVLDPAEGVISARTGHVNWHEAGAIEFSRHKVIALDCREGKLSADTVRAYCASFYADGSREHMVFPGMVYVSHPTEYGTLYTKDEIAALRAVCDEFGMKLYLDGARLAYALACPSGDLTINDIAALCDLFYIGGTKCGALIGEALVFPKGDSPARFVTRIKQHGALLAKGRLVGVQFDALFTDGLYVRAAKSAVALADRVRSALEEAGFVQYIHSPTNQIFVLFDNDKLEKFGKEIAYTFWESPDPDHTVVRIATDWATTPAAVDRLTAALRAAAR